MTYLSKIFDNFSDHPASHEIRCMNMHSLEDFALHRFCDSFFLYLVHLALNLAIISETNDIRFKLF